MNIKEWMEQCIRDSWHDPVFRKGLEEDRLELEKELGRKLPDLPVVVELKAKYWPVCPPSIR